MTKNVLFLICFLCLATACSPSPSDVVDVVPPPTEPIEEILVFTDGNLKINTIVTAVTDLQVQFTPKTKMSGKRAYKPVASLGELENAMTTLREQLPLSSVVILLTDQPIAAFGADKAVPRHGAASVKLRTVIASFSGISFPPDEEGFDRNANVFSRMVLHLFTHAVGAQHQQSEKCLMFDWRDDLELLAKNSDQFCSDTLALLDPILKSKQTEELELRLQAPGQ